jgi:hypothetical protein
MNKVFTFRLDESTSQRLQQLADQTLRSRAGVVRWLINRAAQDNLRLSPPTCIVGEDSTSSLTLPLAEVGK